MTQTGQTELRLAIAAGMVILGLPFLLAIAIPAHLLRRVIRKAAGV